MSTEVAAAIMELVDLGVPLDRAAELVTRVFVAGVQSAPCPQTSADRNAERRREKDRERKREIRRNPQTSAEVHKSPLPIEKDIKEKKERKRERGSRILSDWTPDGDQRAFARKLGLIEAQIDREALKFRNHFAAAPDAKGVKLDWNATWQNWAIRAADFIGCKPVDKPVEEVPRFKTDEEFQAWWNERHKVAAQ